MKRSTFRTFNTIEISLFKVRTQRLFSPFFNDLQRFYYPKPTNQPNNNQRYLRLILMTFSIAPCKGDRKAALDSKFHAVNAVFQVLDSGSLSVKLGVWNPIVNGIPDSLSFIPNSKAQDS